MNIGQLRKITESLPDDAELRIDMHIMARDRGYRGQYRPTIT